MTAVFTVFMTVTAKMLPASGAIKVINLFAVDLVAMFFPPYLAALVAAKPFFTAAALMEEFAAVSAKFLFFFFAKQKGFYGVY